MKKEIPILYSTPMVRAIISDKKTETRRLSGLDVFNENPDDWELFRLDGKWVARCESWEGYHVQEIPCRYGEPGDILWARESFIEGLQMDGEENFILDASGNAVNDTWYKASHAPLKWFDGLETKEDAPWKPSLHMPKAIARIWSEVVDIYLERLQDITDEDAISEGFESRDQFKSLWLSLNGKPKPVRRKNEIVAFQLLAFDEDHAKQFGETYKNKPLWKSINPWVWVIRFKVLSKTGKTF